MCVAALLGCDMSELEWDYVGLNHRGFLVNTRLRGQDVWSLIMDHVRGEDFAGIPGSTIERLNAVPTKYFQLMLQPAGTQAPSRARFLSALRRRIVEELRV